MRFTFLGSQDTKDKDYQTKLTTIPEKKSVKTLLETQKYSLSNITRQKSQFKLPIFHVPKSRRKDDPQKIST